MSVKREEQAEPDFAANCPISGATIHPDLHIGYLGGFAWNEETGLEVGLIEAPDLADKLRWMREEQ